MSDRPINLLLDVSSVRSPLTGLGRYTQNLMQAMQDEGLVDNLQLVRNGNLINELPESALHNSSTIKKKFSRVVDRLPAQQWLRTSRERLISRRFCQQTHDHDHWIYHAPDFNLMPFKGPSVVTIHDLSLWRHPEYHPRSRVKYWHPRIKAISELAEHVLTDSEFQKREIMSLLDLPESRVTAVHLGVSDFFRPVDEQELSSTLTRLNLIAESYSLVVATLEPRKNHRNIIESFLCLPDEMKSTFPLVIAGGHGWHKASLDTRVQRCIQHGWIKLLGYVDEKTLRALYTGCRVFIYPSLYEGFGLPVLEAMACGAPIITSEASPMAEFSQGATTLINPHSVDEITEAWIELMSNSEKVTQMRLAGMHKAQQMSWQKCALETSRVYQKLS